MSYYVYITQVNNCFIADVPALPGCRTFGRSEAEVLENIRDVVRGYLHSLRKRNRTVPKVKVVKLSEQLPLSSRRIQSLDIEHDLQKWNLRSARISRERSFICALLRMRPETA
ncbi:MAG: type II toxin-antitoxin system HicB family antitoxin [Candidatus Manganitrophus sp.]|nr:type II toxin-antitoxin system HicB family antitoxin [Candidatus Manganitrophus sp.]